MSTVDKNYLPKQHKILNNCIVMPNALRIHDLIAKTAHVRLSDSLRVLLALSAVARGCGLTENEILDIKYQTCRPSAEAARHCEEAYLWLYDDNEVAKILYEIEQMR